MRMSLFVSTVLATALSLIGCTTSAIKAAPVSRLDSEVLCSNAGRDCPIGYYSLARTYLKIDIAPQGEGAVQPSEQAAGGVSSETASAAETTSAAPAGQSRAGPDTGQTNASERIAQNQSATVKPTGAAAAARGAVSSARKACQTLAAEQVTYIASWLSKYQANQNLLIQAEGLEARLPEAIREGDYPSDEEIDEDVTEHDRSQITQQNTENAEARRSSDQAYAPFAAAVEAMIADLERVIPEAEAGVEAADKRIEVYSSLCVPQVTITVTPQTVFDGRRYALFGTGDLLSDDTVKITLAQGGLTRVDLSADDQSADIVEAAGALLSFPTRMSALRTTLAEGLDDIVVSGSRPPSAEAVKHWVVRVSRLQELIERLDDALATPNILDGESELRRHQRFALVGSDDEVSIWPGVFARAVCPSIADLSGGGEVANQSGVWVATPIPCSFELVDHQRMILRSEPFAGFDGVTAEPLSIARTRFSDRDTVYDFSSGHMTAANVTAPSPVAVVLGLPFRVIEGIVGSVSAGVQGESGVITAQKNLIAAQTEMLTAQTGLLQAKAALDAQRRASADTEDKPD